MSDSNADDKSAPSHQVTTRPWPGRVRACYGERVLADSENALLLEETRHNPVYYFPVADVRMDWLQSNEHSSHCPFKGQASYWNFHADGASDENLAWAYQNPIAEAAAIRGHIAFYPDRVSIQADE
ncbi:MAG: DUF427 domain-containing protein [Gammaproteobacteria bacterium]|nr:DUF427 domain-containing protein [Gammaproteobacteria bacterium]